MCSATTFDGSCRRRCGCSCVDERVRRKSDDASGVRRSTGPRRHARGAAPRRDERAAPRRAAAAGGRAPGDPIAALGRDAGLGLVVEMRAVVRVTGRSGCWGAASRCGVVSGCYWPEEGVVECVTRDRLGSYRRHWLVINFYRLVAEPVMRVVAGPRRLSYALRDMPPREMPGWILRRSDDMMRRRRRSCRRPTTPGDEPPPPMVRHARPPGSSA